MREKIFLKINIRENEERESKLTIYINSKIRLKTKKSQPIKPQY